MTDPNATVLLERLKEGDASAGEALFELVYGDLRARAGALLGRESGHTLQATALVNEAWMRIDKAGSTP
ncbi:MAG: ECF-type sigma factor, partial [Planctomycetota bacterium]